MDWIIAVKPWDTIYNYLYNYRFYQMLISTVITLHLPAEHIFPPVWDFLHYLENNSVINMYINPLCTWHFFISYYLKVIKYKCLSKDLRTFTLPFYLPSASFFVFCSCVCLHVNISRRTKLLCYHLMLLKQQEQMDSNVFHKRLAERFFHFIFHFFCP